MWDSQAPAFEHDFRVVRYDTRGHGRSPVPAGPYSVTGLGTDLIALLDRLEIERASLCGISLGGATAIWAAINAPERIDRLVVCFSAAHFGPPEGWRERASLVREAGARVVADAVVERWFTPETLEGRRAEVARMREMIAATPAEGYASCCEALAGIDLRGELGRIAAPTLVVSGSRDRATPPSRGRFIAEEIPAADFVELSAVAHLGNVERPEAVNALIREHLASTQTASRKD